jgi:ApbE superfamily uncharacterized protein (UPF0280 family)
MNRERFRFFQCSHFETDLLIGVPPDRYQRSMEEKALREIKRIRGIIEQFSLHSPRFTTSLSPIQLTEFSGAEASEMNIPSEVNTMLQCGIHSGTGPMSSVAGLFAEKTGQVLAASYDLPEILIENGGDLFMVSGSDTTVVIHAGDSPLSGKLALQIPSGTWGICTSSGTVGHSFSYGNADAVTVVAELTPMADAWATSLANRVQGPGDIEKVLEIAEGIPEILGCVIVVRDRVGIRGQFELKPLP